MTVSVPLSEFVFLNPLLVLINGIIQSFRPLIGVCISNLAFLESWVWRNTVFVPLSEYVFLNLIGD